MMTDQPLFPPVPLASHRRARILDALGIVDEYSIVDSAIGPLAVVFNDRGVSFVTDETDEDQLAARFRATVADRPLRRVERLPERVHRAILTGRSDGLDVDLRSVTPFQHEVLTACRSIERGSVRSYRWLAERLGRPTAVRAVGGALAANPVPLAIPCHRVVRSDGRPGGYVFGTDHKETLLRNEAVGHHLAQLNVARFNRSMDHPDLAGFVEMLDPLNELAEASPGFVWRLTGDGANNAIDIHYYDDPLLLVNMSVWTDVESLRDYVYRSAHVDMYRRRREWAEAMTEAHLVLWWVPEGHVPDLAEADARLQQLRRDGPSPDAFTFARPYPAPVTTG